MTLPDNELLSKILSQLETMIRSREKMISWIQKLTDDIKSQEAATNRTKAGAAVLGFVSFFGLFTSLEPLAAGGMAIAGGIGLTTTVVDLTANKVKGDNIEEKLKSIKTADSDLEKLLQQLDTQACKIAKEFNIPKEIAVLFLLVGVPTMAAQLGLQAVKGYLAVVSILSYIKAAHAMKLGTTVFEGGRATSMDAGQVERIDTGLAITKAAKVFAKYAFGVGIAGVVDSWKTENPNRKSVEELLPKLKENVKNLKEIKKKILGIE